MQTHSLSSPAGLSPIFAPPIDESLGYFLSPSGLSKNLGDYVAVDVGEAAVDSVVADGEFFVVDTE